MKSFNYIDQKVIEFLGQPEILELIDQDSQARIRSHQFTLEDAVFFTRTKISGLSGINDLFTESTALKKGTINFDKARLPVFEHLVVQGISVAYVQHASQTDPAKVLYSPLFSAVADTAVRGAELQIYQNGRLVFKRPLQYLFLQALPEDSLGHNRAVVSLDDWRFLAANEVMQWRIEFPDSQTVGTYPLVSQQQYIEVSLFGQKTRKK